MPLLFVKNSQNIREQREGIRKRNETLRQHISKLEMNQDNTDVVNHNFQWKSCGDPVEILALMNNVW